MSNAIMYEIEMNSFNSGKSEDNSFGEYLALGLFDGISINKFIINNRTAENNAGLMPVIDQYYENRIKFEKNNKLLKNQTFLIFKNYIDDKNKKDIEDFMDSKDWNFQFITFSYINTKENKLKFSEKYATHLELENSKKIYIFDTLDNCSFISIVKTKSYQEGLDILLQLGFEKFNNYCFSLATLNKEYQEYEEERINVKINMIVKNYNELKKLEEKLGTTYKGYNLGNTDAFVTYENITVSKLYELFAKNGPFSNENKELLNATFSINTHITNIIENDFISYNPEIIDNTACKKLILEKFHEKIAKIENANSIGKEFIYHLYGVINVLRQVINYDCCELPFLSIYPSLKVLMKELEDIDFTKVSGKSLDEYYNFLNMIKKVIELVTNSSYHTHHDAISNIESNEICGKIISFYNIFVYKMVDAFTEKNINQFDKYHYGFLIAPQLYKKTEIRVLNNSEEPKDRLLIVNIPINQIYNISSVLISLVHECGHFIGDNTRNRDFRLNVINQITSYYCSEIVFNNLNFINENKYEIEIRNFVKKSFWVMGDNILENIIKECSKDCSYLSIYESSVRDKLVKYLSENKITLIDKLKLIYEKMIFDGNKNPSYIPSDYDQYLRLTKLVDKFAEQVSINYDKLYINSNTSLKVLYYELFTILRECFADLFAVVILGLDYVEYLNAFFNSNYGVDLVVFKKQFFTRIAFICKVMNWSANDIDANFAEIKEYAKQVDKQIVHITTGGVAYKDTSQNVLKPFHMQYVWEEVVSYLNECKQSLEQVMKNEKKNMLKDVRSIYKNISGLFIENEEEQNYNIDEVMDLINYSIYSFETDEKVWR